MLNEGGGGTAVGGDKQSGEIDYEDDGHTYRLKDGAVVIAAITSCTNTSNPSVMLAAGLLAKKAVKAGLTVQPHIKTSLAPGSRVVTEYLTEAGLLPYLEKLGFALAGYGCTTCIGNAGDLTPELNEAITSNDLVCAAVLSGNRNFEARIHPNLKANFLASPPLVVAYAIAGNVMKDLMTEPLGLGKGGKPVYLGDVWPTSDEIHKLMRFAMNGKAYRENYARVATEPGKLWERIHGVSGNAYTWPVSSYIAEPPFFEHFELAQPAEQAPAVRGARGMALVQQAARHGLAGANIDATAALCEQFAVSRMTVNKALRELVAKASTAGSGSAGSGQMDFGKASGVVKDLLKLTGSSPCAISTPPSGGVVVSGVRMPARARPRRPARGRWFVRKCGLRRPRSSAG